MMPNKEIVGEIVGAHIYSRRLPIKAVRGLRVVELWKTPKWLPPRLREAGVKPCFYGRGWSSTVTWEALCSLATNSYRGLMDHGGHVVGRSANDYLVGEPYEPDTEAIGTLCRRLRLRSVTTSNSTWAPGCTKRVYLWPAEWGDIDPEDDCSERRGEIQKGCEQ
jgi:hypothetical protein